jgi:DNA-directed RNA polymerase II subunit RPB1
MSVVKLTVPETYENGRPKDEGVLDLRMGSADKLFPCATCHSNMVECPGHFGHIELAKPMFHYGFISTVHMILQCVCFHCQVLLTSTVRFSHLLI